MDKIKRENFKFIRKSIQMAVLIYLAVPQMGFQHDSQQYFLLQVNLLLLGLTFPISLYLALRRVMQKQNCFSSPSWQMLSLDASKLQIEDKQDSL